MRLWLASALDSILEAGDLDEVEVAYLLNFLARLWSLYWAARGQSTYLGVDGHSQERDHKAEIRLLQALEANIM